MANITSLVIQYLMKNRAVTDQDLKNFVNRVNEEETEMDMSELFDEIRNTVNSFNLTVDIVKCELTGIKYFVLFSSVEREYLTELPMLSKDYQDCLYALIDEIMANDGSPLGSNDAINLLRTKTSSRPDSINEILQYFKKKKLLVATNDGYYCLGPLVLTELKSYLTSFGNAKTCSLCSREVVYGKRCTSCSVDMHIYCFRDAQQNKSRNICPSCNARMLSEE